VIQGYGLTETTSLVSVNHPFRLGKGSIGKVLPGREVKLAEDGEILVRGGGVASDTGMNRVRTRSRTRRDGIERAILVRSMKAAIFISRDARKK